MDKTKLSFEIDASQIDVKPLLKKDFLELSMKAVSTANPNRNNSWFTKEAMEKSISTFRNKPILGYFENGDFVSHNGEWNYDSETEMDYWDTLGKKGERILGLIRSEDEVKIVEDKSGLSWITFTCALWTQYSYKQVKRLIKDAKRAKHSGEPTKNISVEVDITDYEMLENGVMKINEFNLVGVTILGSRNGVKVEPGIEDAELSVVDIMGRDLYERQAQSVRLAYERLDDSDKKKEEFQVENEKILKPTENSDGSEATIKEPVSEEHKDFEGEPCPDCGKNPCECENKHCEEEPEDKNPEESEHCEKDPEEGEKPEDKEQCEKDPEEKPEEGKPEDKDDDEGEEDPEDDKDDDDDKHEDEACGGAPEKSEWELKCEELQKQYDELKCAHDELSCKYNELCSKYEGCRDYEEIKNKLSSYEHKEFMSQADALISSAKLEDKLSAQFHKECDDGVITNIADLKVKVAVASFDSKVGSEGKSTLSVPVSNPDTTSFSETTKSKKNDHWASLHEYVEK